MLDPYRPPTSTVHPTRPPYSPHPTPTTAPPPPPPPHSGAPSASVSATPHELPVTGGAPGPLIEVGMALMVLGALALAAARRRTH